MNIEDVFKNSLSEAQLTISKFLADPEQLKKCAALSELMIKTFQGGGRIFACGNGGSHCDSMHFAGEFTGRYRKNRRPLGVLALGDPSHLTCVSNDFGFEDVFARQLQGLARRGDLLLGISTSGNSENVVRAVNAAKEMGISTAALLGRDGGRLKGMTEINIVVPAQTPDRIQEMHIKLLHTLVETVERRLFPENY